jgi:NADH-quinone oxidoreductase subunit H
MTVARSIRETLAAWVRARWMIAILALALVACVREGSPQLIQVLEVAPNEAEVGDRITILGAGFPQGKAAHLAFRGTLHRPGERPIEDTEILAEGTVKNAQQIDLAFTEAMQTLFCGPAGEAAHTTFDGEVEVAFAAASASSPPIAATLYKVSLDVRPPPPRAQIALARDAEGDRALDFIGVVASPIVPPSGGIAVEKVRAGSRAEQAGVAAGDVIVSIDGLRVVNKSDAVPAPGAQMVAFTLRRGSESREQVRQVAFGGFRQSAPAELLGAAIVLALAAALVLLFLAPSPGTTAWVERRFARRLRDAVRERAWLGDRALWIAGALVTALAVVAPLRQYRMAAGLDAAIVFLVIASAIVTAALVTCGGERASFGAMFRAAWSVLSAHLAAALAVAGIVVITGSLRVHDIVRAQGGAPWDWYAFRSPVTLALFVVFAIGIGVDGREVRAPLAEAAAAVDDGASTRRARVFAAARYAALFAACALGVALFLGGWQVPGIDVAGQSGASIAGAAVFVAKAWVLAIAVLVARRVAPLVTRAEVATLAWKWLVPAALVALALAIGWRVWTPPRALERMSSGVIFAGAMLVAAQLAHRVRHGLGSPHAHAHVNPFL